MGFLRRRSEYENGFCQRRLGTSTFLGWQRLDQGGLGKLWKWVGDISESGFEDVRYTKRVLSGAFWCINVLSIYGSVWNGMSWGRLDREGWSGQGWGVGGFGFGDIGYNVNIGITNTIIFIMRMVLVHQRSQHSGGGQITGSWGTGLLGSRLEREIAGFLDVRNTKIVL